jgi:hypothetical protein
LAVVVVVVVVVVVLLYWRIRILALRYYLRFRYEMLIMVGDFVLFWLFFFNNNSELHLFISWPKGQHDSP